MKVSIYFIYYTYFHIYFKLIRSMGKWHQTAEKKTITCTHLNNSVNNCINQQTPKQREVFRTQYMGGQILKYFSLHCTERISLFAQSVIFFIFGFKLVFIPYPCFPAKPLFYFILALFSFLFLFQENLKSGGHHNRTYDVLFFFFFLTLFLLLLVVSVSALFLDSESPGGVTPKKMLRGGGYASIPPPPLLNVPLNPLQSIHTRTVL